MSEPPFADPAVRARFDAFPPPLRNGTLALRGLIFHTAAELPAVGPLHETLKWGVPAYLTPQTKSGSTLRIGLPKQGGFAIYVQCQTSLLNDFQTIYPNDFTYEGRRAVHFAQAGAIQPEKLRMLIARALTYHLKQT